MSTNTLTAYAELNYKSVNVMSSIYGQVLLIKQLTVTEVSPYDPETIDIFTLNNGEY